MSRTTTLPSPIGEMTTERKCRRKADIRKLIIRIFCLVKIRFDFVPPGRPVCTGDSSLGLAGAQANLPALSKLAFFLVASQNTMSGLLAGSLACRRVWLRVGALVLSSHGLLYLYERLLWLSGGREKDLKRKFVAHFQARMRLMIHTVTGSVRQQIQKDLLSSLSEVCSTVETNLASLTVRLRQTEKSLEEISQVTDHLEDLARKAEDLTVKLDDFEDKYLQ